MAGTTLILPLDKPSVACVDVASGERAWVFSGLSAPPGSPLETEGRVYFGALDGNICELSANTGELAWRLQCPGGRISGAPALVDGTLYVAASDGRIYAVEPPAAGLGSSTISSVLH